MSETISQKLDRIDRSVGNAEQAIQRSASKRSTTALAVATVAMFLLICLGIVDRSLDAHSTCARGNDTRAAVLTINGVSNAALLEAIRATLAAGRLPVAQERTDIFIKEVARALDADPAYAEARHQLRQRHCTYNPF